MIAYILFFLSSFFFFKQKTAYEMRISDWSSDVCSSDLRPSGSETLLASVVADPEGEADIEEQQTLTPAVVAALAQSGAYARSTMEPSVPETQQKPAEVVYVAPQPKIAPARDNRRFGDGFDAPQVASVPKKGGRMPGSTSQDAVPALTGNLLTQWAVSNKDRKSTRLNSSH